MRSVYLNVSTRLYGWLLFAYPSHFRQRFGGEMRQTFRDCIYFAANRETLIGFWLRTLVDLFVTAAQERADNSERKGNIMNNWRRDVMALLGCAGIILIAVLLLNYGKQNEVSSILVFGYILDALIVSGVIGNFIIFLWPGLPNSTGGEPHSPRSPLSTQRCCCWCLSLGNELATCM
jgi:hypothetical protein